MALESGTFIDSLNVANPASTDALAQADDHLRLIKSTIKATFPNLAGAVTLTHAEINALQGLAGNLSAPQGTKMLFASHPAPTGWTTQTDNDKALRVVNGSTTLGTGGSAAFTSAFASYTPTGNVQTTISGNVDGTRLTISQTPAHSHLLVANTSSSTSGSSHDLTATRQIKRGGQHELNTHDNEQYNLGGSTLAATIGKSSTVGSNPAGTHTHGTSNLQANSPFQGDPKDFAVQYVDVIIAQKD